MYYANISTHWILTPRMLASPSLSTPTLPLLCHRTASVRLHATSQPPAHPLMMAFLLDHAVPRGGS